MSDLPVTIDCLDRLVGLTLVHTALAADMRMFSFARSQAAFEENLFFALHIQCPWRLRTSMGIFTGSFDLWEKSGEASLQEERLKFLGGFQNPVENTIVVPQTGDITIDFGHGALLEVFPAGIAGENWRFFHRINGSHVVCEGEL